MNIDDVRRIARLSTSWVPGERDTALAEAAKVAAADVLPFLRSEDRNERVAALRVLAIVEDPAAVEGLLLGLDDEKKRVRNVAAKSCLRWVQEPRITARLQRAIEDAETGSARPAFELLSGLYMSAYDNAHPIMTDVLESLARTDEHRMNVLTALLRAPLTDRVRDLLQEIVESGTREEAVLATRRLCGLRVVRLEPLAPALQAKIKQTCERASGQVWWWAPDFLLTPEG
jgi:HEAT repeat protein